MIVVKVEVWPGGNLARSHEIARGEIENRGEQDGVADYYISWTENGRTITGTVTGHVKGSVLDLIKKSLP